MNAIVAPIEITFVDSEHQFAIHPRDANSLEELKDSNLWNETIHIFCHVSNIPDFACENIKLLSMKSTDRMMLHGLDLSRHFFKDNLYNVESLQNTKKSFYAPMGKSIYGLYPNIKWCGHAKFTSQNPGFSTGRYCSFSHNVTVILDCGQICYRRLSSYPWQARYRVKNLAMDIHKSENFFENYMMCDRLKPVTIKNDVFIGEHVVILPEVTIGDGAIIESYSVVRSDVEPYSIVAGNPAVRVGYRFQPEVISELLQIKWWEWSDEKIDSNMDVFLAEDEGQLLIQRAKELEMHNSANPSN